MDKHCIVLTTFESAEQGQPVIDTILERQLAACIQTTDINSHYSWKGEICHDKEILVLMKTTWERFNDLEECIKSLHPYETPEIVAVNIQNGFSGYLHWVEEMTKPKT